MATPSERSAPHSLTAASIAKLPLAAASTGRIEFTAELRGADLGPPGSSANADAQEFYRTTEGRPPFDEFATTPLGRTGPPRLSDRSGGRQQLRMAPRHKPAWNLPLIRQDEEFYRAQVAAYNAEPEAVKPTLTRERFLATPKARIEYVLPPGYEKPTQDMRRRQAEDNAATQAAKVHRVLRRKAQTQASLAQVRGRREQLEATVASFSKTALRGPPPPPRPLTKAQGAEPWPTVPAAAPNLEPIVFTRVASEKALHAVADLQRLITVSPGGTRRQDVSFDF